MKNLLFVIIILTISCSLSAPAFAVDNNPAWTGLTSTSWGTGGNWNPIGIPPVGDVQFNGAGNNNVKIDLGGGVTIGTIRFYATGGASYFIGADPAKSQTLTILNGGGIFVDATDTKTQTIQADIATNDNPNFTFTNNSTTPGALLNITGDVTGSAGAGSGTFTFTGTNTGANTVTGNITNGGGTGTVAVTKDGTGTWVLSGANTYTGGTTLAAGTLNLGSSGAIGTLGTITFNGGTLQYSGSNNTDYSLRFSTGANQAYNIDTNGVNVTLGHAITGSGNSTLTKTGAGILTLTGANTYTGLTTVTAGELDLHTAGTAITGNLTVNGGTAKLLASSQIGTGFNLAVSSGTFNIQTFNQTLAGVQMTGGNIIGTTGVLTSTGAYDMQSGAASAILNGAVAINKTTGGTVTLSGANTYSGGTTLTLGTLSIGNAAALGTGALTINGGTIDASAAGLTLNTIPQNWNGDFAFTGTNDLNLGTGAVTLGATRTVTANAGTLTVGGIIGGAGFGLTKTGVGTLALSGANIYTGATTIQNGTLSVASIGSVGSASSNLGAPTTVPNGTIALGGNAATGKLLYTGAGETTDRVINLPGLAGGTLDQSGTGLLKFTSNLTATGGAGTALILQGSTAGTGEFAGNIIDNVGATSVTKAGTGIWTLSGANTYSGATTINVGTLVAGNASALGNGSIVTVANGAALDVGTTNVTVNAPYIQQGGSTLKVTIVNPSSSGKITSNINAAVDAMSNVNVTVGGYISANTTFTIIQSAAGAGVAVPGTITSSDSRITFSGSSSGANLILTANRLGTGFASLTTNSNAAAAGAVLDNITNPTPGMTTVLNTLEGLSNSQTTSALNTVVPVNDNGVNQTSTTSLNDFIGTTTQRLGGLYAQAHNEETGETGVSTGSKEKTGIDVWGQGFGEYAHQDPRGLSNGYCATVWGTALGGDIPLFNDRIRLGLSGGYASSDVNSKDNSGATNINSYQTTLYAGYIDPSNPYYIDGAFSFAFNKYRGSRNIAVGTIMSTADAHYNGQQYSVLVDGGYTFKAKGFDLTPVASLQYLRLNLAGYTEAGADALDLSVNRQHYNMLESGLGMKLDRPFDTASATVTPEVHARWLYDIINDKQATTSTFSGGGGSFATQGFSPARNALNLGTKLTLATKWNWSLETNYDFEYRQDFTSHTGWADIKYSF